MMATFACDRCGGTGETPYKHIAGGICFKCEGKGTLPYNPQLQGDVSHQPEPDYDAYIQRQEREFWRNLEANEDADDRQRFWEENGFEAS
jgi:DnaJ-class molecular chaperone